MSTLTGLTYVLQASLDTAAYLCGTCGDVYASQNLFDAHVNSCGRHKSCSNRKTVSAATTSTVTREADDCTGGWQLLCESCDKNFISQRIFSAHLKTCSKSTTTKATARLSSPAMETPRKAVELGDSSAPLSSKGNITTTQEVRHVFTLEYSLCHFNVLLLSLVKRSFLNNHF